MIKIREFEQVHDIPLEFRGAVAGRIRDIASRLHEKRCPFQGNVQGFRYCDVEDCTAWTVTIVSPVKTVMGEQGGWTVRIECSMRGFAARAFSVEAQDSGDGAAEVAP